MNYGIVLLVVIAVISSGALALPHGYGGGCGGCGGGGGGGGGFGGGFSGSNGNFTINFVNFYVI